jgi:hypothetical protein
MDYTQITNLAALYTLGLIIGGMVFFAAVMTPLVFTKLPPEISGPFIREVFPVFSKVMAGLSFVSAALIWNHPSAYALLVVFFLFIWTWKWLMPKINQFRDEELGGNAKAGKAFNMLHKLSVYINLAQMIIVTVVFLKIVP